jgi:hypothetical protein
MSVEAVAGNAQGAVNPDELEVAAGQEHENLHGWVPDLTDERLLREALDKAFDYRGNITVHLHDGGKLEGYVFDRHAAPDLRASYVRIIPIADRLKIKISYADVRSLEFTGKDTAAGKSFESWVAKYWAKKAAGEKNIQIEPESLD